MGERINPSSVLDRLKGQGDSRLNRQADDILRSLILATIASKASTTAQEDIETGIANTFCTSDRTLTQELLKTYFTQPNLIFRLFSPYRKPKGLAMSFTAEDDQTYHAVYVKNPKDLSILAHELQHVADSILNIDNGKNESDALYRSSIAMWTLTISTLGSVLNLSSNSLPKPAIIGLMLISNLSLIETNLSFFRYWNSESEWSARKAEQRYRRH